AFSAKGLRRNLTTLAGVTPIRTSEWRAEVWTADSRAAEPATTYHHKRKGESIMSILTQTKRQRGRLAVSVALTFLLNPGLGTLLAAPPPQPPKTPNILFFIMDDVGIDQMLTFGYGGATS